MSHYFANSSDKMILKFQINFKLRPYGSKKKAYQIQMHTTYSALRLRTSTGCQLDHADAWDEALEVVKPGYEGNKGATTLSINKTLRTCRERMELVFKYFEANEIIPTLKQVEEKYQEKLRGVMPKRPEPEPRKEQKPRERSLWECFTQFCAESGEKNAWTSATQAKMDSLKVDLQTFNPKLTFSSLTDSTLTAFVVYLRDKKVLRTPRQKKGNREEYDTEDITGIKNSTIEKKLGYLRWFLQWATDRGYNNNLAFRTFRPTLKKTQKKVIYLTKEELRAIQALDLTGEKAFLDPVRDVLLFCCFSGLRHSDVYNLKTSDIKEDHMVVTTIKTGDTVFIELNDVTTKIISRYKDVEFEGGKALPVISNQAMNRDLKKLCKLAGIDEEIMIVTFKGNERQEVVKKKWELVGTHTGRRTFIVNALSLGVPPSVVMKWTGHSDYNAMKPYIDIVDSIKASEMKKLDTIL